MSMIYGRRLNKKIKNFEVFASPSVPELQRFAKAKLFVSDINITSLEELRKVGVVFKNDTPSLELHS